MEQLTVAKTKTLFKLKYSTTIRVWHWLTFLLMIASMVTVLFASTLFEHDGGKPSDKGQEQRTEQQGEEHTFNPSKLDPEAKAACTYSNKIWDAHKIIGFGLCFLLLSRVFINIRLEVNNNQLHFTVKNKFEEDKATKDKTSGIGLVNGKRRLELLYPSKHKLRIDKKDGFVYSFVTINFKMMMKCIWDR